MFTPTFGDAGRRTVSDEAGDTVDSAKKQLRMVLAPKKSYFVVTEKLRTDP